MSADQEAFVAVNATIAATDFRMHWNDNIGKYVLYLGDEARAYLPPAIAQRLYGLIAATLIERGDAVDFAQIASMAVAELKNAAAELKWAGELDSSARVTNTIAQLGYVAEEAKSE